MQGSAWNAGQPWPIWIVSTGSRGPPGSPSPGRAVLPAAFSTLPSVFAGSWFIIHTHVLEHYPASVSWEWVVWSRWCFWASSEWWGLWTKVSHLWEVLQPGGSGMEEKGRNPSLEITQLSNVWRVWFCCMRCVQTFLCLAAFGDLVFGCSAKAGTEMLRLGLPGCA